MKTLIAALVLMSSVTAMAADQKSVPCRIQAHSAAAALFSQENPGVGFFLRAKYKPVLEAKIVYHMVEISEYDGGRVTGMTVSLNPATCSVLSID